MQLSIEELELLARRSRLILTEKEQEKYRRDLGDLEELSSCEEVKKATVPVIFFHGEEDDFVPCYMSKQNYDACPSRKALVTIPGAGHGLSYPVAKEQYLQAMRDFFGE